jgi:hypothetical protein
MQRLGESTEAALGSSIHERKLDTGVGAQGLKPALQAWRVQR